MTVRETRPQPAVPGRPPGPPAHGRSGHGPLRPGRSWRRLALYASPLAVAGIAAVTAVLLSASPGGTVVFVPPQPALTLSPHPGGPLATAKASLGPGQAKPPAQPTPHKLLSPGPVAGAEYAGPVVLNATGQQLKSWNQTQAFCTEQDWEVPDGSVYTDPSNDAVVATTGKDGSCAGLISPQAYSSAVIEAYAYFPPLPGHAGTIADWSSLWLTDEADWPAGGELDAVEAEPATGVNATAWHWGSSGNPQSMSTDGFAQGGTLPKNGPNLTPGWHVVDIVYAQGFFAVYYDAKLFTSLHSDAVTGAALNLLITTSMTPDSGKVEQQIGGAPVNSDSQPAGLAVKYVKIWKYR